MPARKPHDRWLRERVDRLLAITAGRPPPARDFFPAKSWTWLKLAALDYYIPVYLRILRERYRRLVYVDLFAGSGESLYQDSGVRLCAPGSALVAASYRGEAIAHGSNLFFDELYCIERDSGRVATLRATLERAGYREGTNLTIVHGDANDSVDGICAALRKPRTHALLFADPEELNLAISTLAAVTRAHDGTDVFVTHLNVGAARGDYSSRSPARDLVYGDGRWVGCRTREDYTRLYEKILTELREVVIPIPIRGDFDAPGYNYDLFFAVRETSGGTTWRGAVEKLRAQVRALSGEEVRHVIRTRVTAETGGRRTRQGTLEGD